MRRPARVLVLAAIAAAPLLSACTRGPDEQALRAEVQDKVSRHFEPGLLEVVSLKRRGSAPLPATEGGANRLVVYFNATVRLTKDYQFGDWEGLSPASLANVLGASQKGLTGINAQNRKGDVVYAYGSSTYERSGDAWQSVGASPTAGAALPEPGDAAPPTQSQKLLERLASMVNLPPPGVSSTEERVISEELDRALRAIARRMERQKKVLTFASGPAGGEYRRIAEAVVRRVGQLATGAKVRAVETQGSVENVWLLDRGDADFALMQSDVAALAAAGEGPFARGGPIATLRALASLFPEPVHVVVAARSPIRSVTELRGKRVGIGPPDSGTRENALAVLRAHGLERTDLGTAREQGTDEAVRQLRAGSLDAFFVTIAAPAGELQALATRGGMRLLSLDDGAAERLVAERPGLVRLAVRANTYPGQTEDVRTVAATALLVATAETPDAEVELLLKVVFEGADFEAAGSGQGTKVSVRTALRGITIPMHSGAGRYLKAPAKS